MSQSLLTFPLATQRPDKTAAVRALARELGIEAIAGRADEVVGVLNLAVEKFGTVANKSFSFSSASNVTKATITGVHSERRVAFSPPVYTNGRPTSFSPQIGMQVVQEGLSYLSLPDGVFVHFAGAPIVVDSKHNTIVDDFSSRYSKLVYFYDRDLATIVETAIDIPGRAIVLSDDIRPLNFCHWLIDALPRLAIISGSGRHSDLYVVVTKREAAFQLESLELCGFDLSHVIWLEDFQAVRAKELIVPSDVRTLPHPAHKGASWATSYLRSNVGLGALQRLEPTYQNSQRIYLSREDASRRKVSNDDELFAALQPLGYKKLVLGRMTLEQQIYELSYASHVIGLHGAGLSNIVFSPSDMKIIEIFPETYGTPAFYIIAASLGAQYSTYMGQVKTPTAQPQFDNVVVDVRDFIHCCASEI
jgi:capsular polysaccharide biosynthesis protein